MRQTRNSSCKRDSRAIVWIDEPNEESTKLRVAWGHLNPIEVPIVTGLSLRRRTESKCHPFAHLVDGAGEALLRCSTPNSPREPRHSKGAEKWGHDCQWISGYKSSELVDGCSTSSNSFITCENVSVWTTGKDVLPSQTKSSERKAYP